MITVDGGQQAILDSSVRGATYLIDVEWLSGTQYYNTFVTPIVANGHTYTGLGNLLTISPMRESESLSMEKLTLRLSLVDTAMLAYSIGPATEYRNRAVRIYLQLLGETWAPVQNPILRWSGVMDTVKIERKPSQTGLGTGSIEMLCMRAGLSRFRNSTGLRMSHEQQQLDYPGDMGLEYTESLVKTPPVWLSKKFLEV
jgi:hypothetical protein